MCLDCGKWEPALSQCKPCSCSQSAGWSRGQTHCLHRGGGKVSMEETRRHSPLSLPCDVLSQQVPHSVYSSPPCVGLCTHHSSAASDIIIVLLYLCSWGFASKLYSNISSSVFGRGWVIDLPIIDCVLKIDELSFRQLAINKLNQLLCLARFSSNC